MSVPYEMPPMSGILVNGGETVVVEVDFPSRAVISKIILKQYDGTPAIADITLFNHPVVNDGGGDSISDSEPSQVGPIPEECYMIGPRMSTDGDGVLIYFSDIETGGHGLVFFNQESVAHRERGHKRKLYARIQPQGSGQKAYALAIGGEAME